MLPGTSPDARASLHDTVNLAISLSRAPLGIIIFHIAKRRLIRKSTYCPGAVSLPCPKDDFCIFVGVALIIPRKIQVDIRLFISLESQKCLKWDVVSVFNKRRSADWACFIRHVPPAAACICPHFLRLKIAVMAFFTVIMGA